MPVAGEDLAGARQAVGTLLPLAVQAAGGMRPDEDRHTYLARVRQLAVDLWLETSAESETVRRIAELAACRTFPAVLLGVRVEPSTTRGVLTLRSWGPEGERQEEIRTDRTDDPRGVQTLELARGLVGHRVTVYKLEEPGRSAYQRYRCAKHLVDLGPADPTPADPSPAEPTPVVATAVVPTAVEPATRVRRPPTGQPGAAQPPATDGGPAPTPTAAAAAAARRSARRRPEPARRVEAPGAGETHPGGEPATAPDEPAAGGVAIERARAELLAAIGGDEEFRAASPARSSLR